MVTSGDYFNFFSKSDKFYQKMYLGEYAGRRLNVWDIFRIYFSEFMSIATNLFSYNVENGVGLYISYDFFKELEKRLFLFGKCGIVRKDNDLIAVSINPNGQDIYNNPDAFSFSFGGGIEDIDGFQRTNLDNGIICKNTYMCRPSAAVVEQYSLMLAHCDMSIIADMVNNRCMDVLIAHSNRDAESARDFHRKLYDGNLSFIMDTTEDLEVNRASQKTTHLKDLIDTKDRLLKDIYAEFGIKRINEKRERMITGELEVSEKLMRYNLLDMLNSRIKICDDVNKVFGAKISVKSHVDINDNTKEDDGTR